MTKFRDLIEKVTVKKDAGKSTGGAGTNYSINGLSIFIPQDEDSGVNINLDGDEFAVDYDDFKDLVSKLNL